MVLRSVAACMDSSDWLQGGRMQDSGFKSLQEDMLSCPRPLMDRRLKPNAELMLKCPRCDSPNTKFCYYNNYSLSQPRYFCKTCRRYWTKGGTLRNVPVGGGCRKNKRFKRTSDQPCQTNPSASLHDNEINSCSPPNLVEQGLNLPPVPSVYFTLLNGGADGLGVAYSSPSVQQQQHNLQALKVAAVAAADRPALTGNGNSNNSGGMIMMEVPSTAQGTARHGPLVGLSNLNAFQSPPNLMAPSGPDQTAALMQINGDLSTIFEAAHHHQNQQVPTSSPPTVSHVSSSSDRYHDGTGVQDHRLNSGLHDHQDVQWQHKLGISVEDHDLPFDHENHHQLRPPPPPPSPPHHDIKLRQVIMNSVQSPLGGGGEVCEENRHAAINSYNWQLPISEGLPDNSGSNINYWNGAATWPDLSCYAPYTNPLI